MRNASEVTLDELNASRVDLLITLAPELGVMWKPTDLVFKDVYGEFSFSTGLIKISLPRILKMALNNFQIQARRGWEEEGMDENGKYLTFLLSISYDSSSAGRGSFNLSDSFEDSISDKIEDFNQIKAIYHIETRKWSVSV